FHRRDRKFLERYWVAAGWYEEWNNVSSVSGLPDSFKDQAYIAMSRKWMLREWLPTSQAELRECYWFKARYSTPAELEEAIADIDRHGEVLFYALMYAPVFGTVREFEGNYSLDD